MFLSVSDQDQCDLMIGHRTFNYLEFHSMSLFFNFQMNYQINTYEIAVQNINHQKLVLFCFSLRFKDKPKAGNTHRG